MNQELANLLFPHIDKTGAYYEEKYPERNLEKGALVTRFAPSPTGFVHMGSLYTAFIAMQMAKQSGGVFYLRIEDTDQKREVEDGISGILRDLQAFDFTIQEGPIEGGKYAPYIQSERVEIYQTFAKELVERGFAYPCFCSEEELTELRQRQELEKTRIGYYGVYAVNRNLTLEEIKEKLEAKVPYVIRLKSPGDFHKTITFHDCIKGDISFPENDMDIVLLKQDGIPTYHFAHAIDDHLMRTTHIIRGDEWLSSVPIHLQLFQVLGFKAPKYAHIAPLTKREGESTRKLSKRKDPEASVRFYQEQGIPTDAVKLFLSTLINANFEPWYQQNKTASIDEFKFQFNKMPVGGTYFDLEKLTSISKIYLSMRKATELYENGLQYFKQYDEDFYGLMQEKKDQTIALLNIEREIKRPRKDLASYQDIKKEFENFYDEIFLNQDPTVSYQALDLEKEYDFALLEQYEQIYSEEDSKEEWMEQLKSLAEKNGYAKEVKEYKEHPEQFKGHVGDVCETVRAAVTGKTMSPDLYEILKVLGKDSLKKRINHFHAYLESKNK